MRPLVPSPVPATAPLASSSRRPRAASRYPVASLLSLVLHLLGVWVLAHVGVFMPAPLPPPAAVDRPTLTVFTSEPLAPEPPESEQRRTVIVPHMQEQATPPKRPRFESDRNAAAGSPTPSERSLSAPNIEGDRRNALTLVPTPKAPFETPLPGSKLTPQAHPSDVVSVPRPAAQNQPAPSPTPNQPNLTSADPDGPNARAPRIAAAPDGIFPPPSRAAPAENAPAQRTREVGRDSKLTGPPPQPFDVRRSRNTVIGGRAQGAPALDTIATPLGKYRATVYRFIESQWHYDVEKQGTLLSFGSVNIRFTLDSQGRISDIRVVENTAGSAIFEAICIGAIRKPAPYPALPDAVREQVGDALPLDVSFTIY